MSHNGLKAQIESAYEPAENDSFAEDTDAARGSGQSGCRSMYPEDPLC